MRTIVYWLGYIVRLLGKATRAVTSVVLALAVLLIVLAIIAAAIVKGFGGN